MAWVWIASFFFSFPVQWCVLSFLFSLFLALLFSLSLSISLFPSLRLPCMRQNKLHYKQGYTTLTDLHGNSPSCDYVTRGPTNLLSCDYVARGKTRTILYCYSLSCDYVARGLTTETRLSDTYMTKYDNTRAGFRLTLIHGPQLFAIYYLFYLFFIPSLRTFYLVFLHTFM